MTAGALASALPRMQEAGHERAAGEWQAEWVVLPQLGTLAGTAVDEAVVIVEGMRVDPERMAENLRLDGGLIMAEAQMIQLAQAMGRERAHDLVYEAATRARSSRRVLAEVLPEVAAEQGVADLLPERLVEPEGYLGEAGRIAETAARAWRSARRGADEPAGIEALAAELTSAESEVAAATSA